MRLRTEQSLAAFLCGMLPAGWCQQLLKWFGANRRMQRRFRGLWSRGDATQRRGAWGAAQVGPCDDGASMVGREAVCEALRGASLRGAMRALSRHNRSMRAYSFVAIGAHEFHLDKNVRPPPAAAQS